MSTRLTEHQHVILDRISQRRNNKITWWYIGVINGFECRICDSFIGTTTTKVNVHGLNHLKEKGLLCFL